MKNLTLGPLRIMVRARRYPFTLLEIIISMTLLTMLSTFFVYKGWSLICEHRFLSAIRRVQNEIYAAKINAISYDREIKMNFTPDAAKTLLTIEIAHPPKGLQSLTKQKIDLPNLHLKREIIFYPNGYISSSDPLIMQPVKGKSKPRILSLTQIDRVKVKEEL